MLITVNNPTIHNYVIRWIIYFSRLLYKHVHLYSHLLYAFFIHTICLLFARCDVNADPVNMSWTPTCFGCLMGKKERACGKMIESHSVGAFPKRETQAGRPSPITAFLFSTAFYFTWGSATSSEASGQLPNAWRWLSLTQAHVPGTNHHHHHHNFRLGGSSARSPHATRV